VFRVFRGLIPRVIRNIIFDWSGTLVDDLPAVLKASNFVLAQAGKPEMSLETFRAEFSLPFTKFYDRHTPEVPMPQLESWFHSRFKQVQDSVAELPHARGFLEFCRAKKLRLFLLSTVHADHFEVQCRVTGFDAFLEKSYTDVWDKRKKKSTTSSQKTNSCRTKHCLSVTWNTTSRPCTTAACIPAPF